LSGLKSKNKKVKMKKIQVILLMLLITSVKVFANTDLSIQAEKLYEQKKYEEAILIYESLLSSKLTSPKLYYNLGNCYFKINQIGKAIYNYELAKKINPKDEDTKVNLKIANTKTIDKIENKENYFIGALKATILNYYTSAGWAWLSIISFTVTLFVIFLFFVSKSMVLKRIGFFIGIISFSVFIGSMILGYSTLNYKDQINYAIILRHELKVNVEPSSNSDTKFSLHEGTKVSVINQTSQWVNIKLENGNEGWVESSNVGLF
jgi:tetratricopeptide (TPR) repeat protein